MFHIIPGWPQWSSKLFLPWAFLACVWQIFSCRSVFHSSPHLHKCYGFDDLKMFSTHDVLELFVHNSQAFCGHYAGSNSRNLDRGQDELDPGWVAAKGVLKLPIELADSTVITGGINHCCWHCELGWMLSWVCARIYFKHALLIGRILHVQNKSYRLRTLQSLNSRRVSQSRFLFPETCCQVVVSLILSIFG